MMVVIIRLRGLLIRRIIRELYDKSLCPILIRIEHMWKDEVLRNGLEKASLKRVVWKFIRTRALLDIFLYLLSLSFGFLGPVRRYYNTTD